MKSSCTLCLLVFLFLLQSAVVLSFVAPSLSSQHLDIGTCSHQLVLPNLQMPTRSDSRRVVALSLKKARRANNPKRIMQEQGYDELIPGDAILDDQLSFVDAQLSMLDDSGPKTTAATPTKRPQNTLNVEALMLQNQMLEKQLAFLNKEKQSFVFEREEEIEHMEQLSSQLLQANQQLATLSADLERKERARLVAQGQKAAAEKRLVADMVSLRSQNQRLALELKAMGLEAAKLEAAEELYKQAQQQLDTLQSEKAHTLKVSPHHSRPKTTAATPTKRPQNALLSVEALMLQNQMLEKQLALLNKEKQSFVFEREEEIEHMEQLSSQLLQANQQLATLSADLERKERARLAAQGQKAAAEKRLVADMVSLRSQNQRLTLELNAMGLEVAKLEAAEELYKQAQQQLDTLQSEKAQLKTLLAEAEKALSGIDTTGPGTLTDSFRDLWDSNARAPMLQWATLTPASPPPVAAAAPATVPASGSTGTMFPLAKDSATLASGTTPIQASVPLVEQRLKLKMVNVAGQDLMLPMDQAMEMLANGSARPIASERAPRAEEPEYGLVEVNVDGSIIMVPDNVVDVMVAAGAAKRTAPTSENELVEVLVYGQSVYIPATQARPLVAAGLAQWSDAVLKAPAPAPVAGSSAPISDPDALVEVNMNGMNMLLPAEQAEQMIAMGTATHVCKGGF